MLFKARQFFVLAVLALACVFQTAEALKTGVYTISNQGVPKSCKKKGSYLNSNKCKTKNMPLSLSNSSNTWELNFDKVTGLASIRAACGKKRGAHLSAQIINCDGKVRFLNSGPRFVWLIKKAKNGFYTIEFSNHWANYDGACYDVFLGVEGSGCGSLSVLTPSGNKTLWKISPFFKKGKPPSGVTVSVSDTSGTNTVWSVPVRASFTSAGSPPASSAVFFCIEGTIAKCDLNSAVVPPITGPISLNPAKPTEVTISNLPIGPSYLCGALAENEFGSVCDLQPISGAT